MSEQGEQELLIRRILVALDVSTHSLAALAAAAELAASLQAELVGLYVEDENLIHLAGLPFAHEVRSPSARRHPIDRDQMKQELRLQATQARNALAQAAERVHARWTFRVVRGQVSEAVLEAALEADLLAMGRVGRPLSSRSRLGSIAREASTKTKRPVLLLQHGSDLHYPVLVTYDGSPGARQALAAASRLAQASGDDLNVLLVGDDPEEFEKLKRDAADWLSEQKLTARYHTLPKPTVDRLAHMVNTIEDCVLVLGGENPLLKAEAIQELLDETDCPVMLVR